MLSITFHHAPAKIGETKIMNATEKIRQGIINALEERNLCGFDYANSYGEPGYSSEKPIILGDWNEFNQSELDAIERYFELEWYDEWTILYDEDSKAYLTTHDSYGWQSSIVIWNGEYVSYDYLKESGELSEYITEELCDSPLNALRGSHVSSEDLEAIGAVLVKGDFENGFHAYQTDDPTKILELYPDRREDMFFRIDGVGQFDVSFELWELKE